MASKNAKQSKKDSTPPNAPAANELSMDALTSHKAEIASEFKISFSALEAKIDLVQTTVSSHGQRITSLETNADSVDGPLLSLEATCAELHSVAVVHVQDVNEKLKAKTADLEARSRRNNVGIVGLAELIEGPRPTDFFSGLLFQLLGEETLPKSTVLDRAHRSLGPKPKEGERPRPVIVWFHDYQTKEKVLREARRKGPTYNTWGTCDSL